MKARTTSTARLAALLRVLNRREVESGRGLTWRERNARRRVVAELDRRNVWTRSVRVSD